MLVFLKLGGSLITDKTKPFTHREDVIRNIARNIKKAINENDDLNILLGHGSGSFAHYPAKKYRVKEGIINESSWRGYAETRAAASKLNQILTELFLDEGVNVVSLQPSSAIMAEDGRIVHMFTEPLKFLLKNNQIPVIYGDAILDVKKGCSIASTEDLFVFLAKVLNPDRIIFAGLVDGVYDSDPLKNENAKLIPEITVSDFKEIERCLEGSHGIDVTGGMYSKVMKMVSLVAENPGLKVQVISGVGDNVYRALSGERIGTLIH